MVKILKMTGIALAGLSLDTHVRVFTAPALPNAVSMEIHQTPVPEEPVWDLYQYDQRAFHIAAILAKRELSSSGKELLDLAQLILDKSEEVGVPPAIVLAVIDVESTFRPCARSKVGAKGLMQVMPHRILGPNRIREEYAFRGHVFWESSWNISFGINYLGGLVKRFGSLEHALAAYNLGPTRLSRMLRDGDYSGSKYADRVLRRVKRYTVSI